MDSSELVSELPATERYKRISNEAFGFTTKTPEGDDILSEAGKNLTVDQLTDLSKTGMELEADMMKLRQEGKAVQPKPFNVEPGHYREVPTHEYQLAGLALGDINRALVLNADRIVGGLDPEVLRTVITTSEMVPTALQPVLELPGINAIIGRLEPVVLRNYVQSEISRTPRKGELRTGADFSEGGYLARRLLQAQAERTKASATTTSSLTPAA